MEAVGGSPPVLPPDGRLPAALTQQQAQGRLCWLEVPAAGRGLGYKGTVAATVPRLRVLSNRLQRRVFTMLLSPMLL